ncbi:MAG: HEPN domain-containing protein [Nanoarchaeota archaeon]|nr:HEPN domain-containing protein [Nanoarchaeota archaeon]
MKKNNFLSKLKKEEKLELVEPSIEVCSSYLEKADDCLASAKLLYENKLYENSVSMSYYTMYNSLIALLFKLGIKSENHSGSILLLKLLLGKNELFDIVSNAKKERVDKQYYVITEGFDITKDSAGVLVLNAGNFLLNIKLVIKKLNNKEIDKIRKDFLILVD